MTKHIPPTCERQGLFEKFVKNPQISHPDETSGLQGRISQILGGTAEACPDPIRDAKNAENQGEPPRHQEHHK
jgi:hypothetical protein